ncbi:MAG: ERCC4 domain-containing protein [Promethearchaeota archaeon]
MLKIIVDVREKKIIDLINKRNENGAEIQYEVERLDVADIIVSDQVAIERKEGFDFVASIKDNRLFDQLLRLKEAYPEGAILILEGFNNDIFENTGMSINSIYGALSFLSYKLGISVIPTRNLEETVIVIERIAIREQVKDDMPLLSRVAPKGMNEEERRYFIVEGLIDIGSKKAKLLVDTFKTPYNVLKAIRDTKIVYTKTGNPKGITGPLKEKNLKGFSWKFIQKNKEMLFGPDYQTQKNINEY